MMPSDEEIEKQIQKNEKGMRELSIRIENLNRQVNELLTELNVTPEQLTALIEKKENFTEDNWSELLKQKQALDEKLQRELKNIRDPSKAKKTFAERKVEKHWLFIR
jgi:hypothetical protein